jgi:sugar O-acyltransferase (sialic acid O-acetyltransferase NeuD family)
MIDYVTMPKFGANIESGTIVSWLKSEGEMVEVGEVIAEVETTKAVFDLEAESSGTLRKILTPAGVEVSANNALAIIAGPDDDITDAVQNPPVIQPNVSAEYIRKMDASVLERPIQVSGSPRPLLTPKARKLLRDLDIPPHAIDLKHGTLNEAEVEALADRQKVYIYGASTGAKQLLEINKTINRFLVLGLIDDNPELLGAQMNGIPVLGGFEWLEKQSTDLDSIGVLISSHSENRRLLYERVRDRLPGVVLPAAVDDRAVLMSGVSIGDGSLIEAGVILGHEVLIGENVIINIGGMLSHNCTVGDHVHIAIGVKVSGAVQIGTNALVGAGAAINPGVAVGRNVIVAPGSAVMNDTPDDVLVSGVPARIIGKSKRA